MDENETETLTITVDRTTAMMLRMMAEEIDRKPEVPDTERHAGTQLESVARNYDAWERKVGAWRLLAGVRLTNEALEQLP